LPSSNTLIAKAIACTLAHPFGVGGSRFRTGAVHPLEVDTVFGGCYKREVFDKVGMFNENLLRSQDLELNLRLKRAGEKIILAPDIVASYYPRSTLTSFFLHNVQDGIWAIYPFKFTKMPFRVRHYIPLLFLLTLPLSVWFYIPVNILFSLQIALRERNIQLVLVLPFVFGARHVGYGIGSLIGLGKLVLPLQKKH
jgi:GT2 family glycosyltransferase